MAPGLTPAEILARRKNYATSVIKAQNPLRTPKQEVKEGAKDADDVSKPAAEEDQRTKLLKWMEEKKRRDMEATRHRNREKNQEKQQQQQIRPTKLSRKTTEVAPKTNPPNPLSGFTKNPATPGSKSAMVKPKETRSDTSLKKKVAFDDASCAQNQGPRETTEKQHFRATPVRHSHPRTNGCATVPPYATPSRLSSKKFDTLSPDSKFGHWLQLKGKTPQQIKHIGCVTPASKSALKKKKSLVSFSTAAPKIHSPVPPSKFEEEDDDDAINDPFADLLTRLEGGKCTEAMTELTKLTAGSEASWRSHSRYWLCLAHLHLLQLGAAEVDREKSFDQRKKDVFAALEMAIDSVAKPKSVLAEGAKKLLLKLFDRVEARRSKSEASNGTFTLEDEDDKEKNDTYTKEDSVTGSSLTPPASPEAPGLDASSFAALASPILSNAALSSNNDVVDVASTIASTPIVAPSPIAAATAAPPPFSLSLDTPTKTVALPSEPLSPPLSDVEEEEEKDERVAESPPRREDIVAEAASKQLPLPGSPQSVSAELVTTSPHFIGVRHSKPVMELLDETESPLAKPLDLSLREEEVEESDENRVTHDNTTATSGCSSLHEVTNISTWANFDSNESLKVTELSYDVSTQPQAEFSVDNADYVRMNDEGSDDYGDTGGIDAQSFSEVSLAGDSSPVSDASSTDLLPTDDKSTNEAGEEVGEEEANKENISPAGVPDLCADTNYLLMASPILNESQASKLHKSFSQRVGQPFASSTVKLLVKDEAPTEESAIEPVEEEEEEEEEVDEEEGELVEAEERDRSDEENSAPLNPMMDGRGDVLPRTPPLSSRKSILKSASKVVVTPVRRSIRQTPRTKATEEKRRLVDDMDDLSPQARKNSVLVPNSTILNLSFGQVVDDDDDKEEEEG